MSRLLRGAVGRSSSGFSGGVSTQRCAPLKLHQPSQCCGWRAIHSSSGGGGGGGGSDDANWGGDGGGGGGGGAGEGRPGQHLSADGGVWDDGGGAGFAWKERYLDERRGVALTFLGDVSKRRALHDAVRVRAKMNRLRLAMPPPPPPAAVLHEDDDDDDDDLVVGEGGATDDASSSSSSSSSGRSADAAWADRQAASGVLLEAMLLNTPTADRGSSNHKGGGVGTSSTGPGRGRSDGERSEVDAALDGLFDAMGGDGEWEGEADGAAALEALPAHEWALLKAELLGNADPATAGLREGVLPDAHGSGSSAGCTKPFGISGVGGAATTGGAAVAAAAGHDKLLRAWLRLRRDSEEFQSFASVPEAERRAWMPWYLKHVRPGRRPGGSSSGL